MSARFDSFFEWLMKWEGEVYENDPDDQGGETKYGIDKVSHPGVDIRSLTRDRAKEIYRRDYWGAVKADSLPGQLDWIIADIAVNNGKARAIKWLQKALGVPADGILGNQTLSAAISAGNNVCADVLRQREDFYRSIARGGMAKFLKGWLNRNNDLAKVTGIAL